MEEKKQFSFWQHISMFIRGIKLYSTLPKPVLASSAVSSVFEAAVPFINIYFAAAILNELAGPRAQNRLIILAALTIIINLAGSLIQKALMRWKQYCGSDTWTQVLKILHDKALGMDFDILENAKLRDEASLLQQYQFDRSFGLALLEEPIPQIIQGSIKVILSVVLTVTLFTLRVPEGSSYKWLTSPWAVAVIVFVLCGPVFLAPYLTTKGGKIWNRVADEDSADNRFFGFYFYGLHENNMSAKDIRLYDQKRIIKKQTMSQKDMIWKKNKSWDKIYKYEGKYTAAGIAITYLCNGLIFLFVALKAFAGAFGVGNIVLYVGAITQFGMGFSDVLSKLGQLVNNNPFLDRWFKYLDIPNSMYQGDTPIDKQSDAKYEIEFRDVSFKYPSTDAYALRNVSLRFNIGQRLAIVGENGSGKTTFIKLLCRLYDPTEGEILLNGVNIKEYACKEYMAIFSVVFQDFELLPLTLGQNVAVEVNYDENRVINALESAGFSARLTSMPKGLKTSLYKNFDEDGVEVSGGEAQKIALARALYKEAPFIILDEPTAALDPIAEYEVYSRMNDIVGGKTAVFISHRLSSCRFCGDIVVFHEGRLIQRGSHEDLLADTGNKYSELWNAQAQYYQAG